MLVFDLMFKGYDDGNEDREQIEFLVIEFHFTAVEP